MKVIIFDKIEIISIGIEQIIKSDADVETVAFFDEIDIFNYLNNHKLDVIVLGFGLNYNKIPDFVKKIRKNYSELSILIISDKIDELFVFNCLKIGVLGIVEKNSSSNEILEAVKTIDRNKEYFSPNISDVILKSYVAHIKNGEEISEKKPRNLTRREIQILKLVCEGLTNQQIADGLFISIRTVNAHKNHIMQKLNLKTTADLIKFAIKNEYVKL